MREKIKYGLYNAFFSSIAFLPLGVLYCISDSLYFVFRRILNYRQAVIRENLRNSFPEKNEDELLEIEKDFYHQLCDNIVESAKLLHISDKEVDRRITVSGGELVDKAIAEGHPVILYLGHYGNWEWVPAIVRHYKAPEISAQVYKPLHDKAFDRIMLKIRSRFNPVSIPKNSVLRTLLRWRNEQKKFIVGFISDHRTNSDTPHNTTIFLNQVTSLVAGGEEIGNRINAAYLYLDVEKPARGHYHFTVKEIIPKSDAVNYPYTRRYMEMFEETIRRRPGLWLWSHKRWLRKK
ncbi:MAG: lysophospholipid acyltransferase family protein [Duncaniella sp.]|nr:lysophospholipid acyltransferase family protein [Duncaniella sp.]MDE7145327.1 lysophospholipid acyltransferase family protein [Duncaniella sp.]